MGCGSSKETYASVQSPKAATGASLQDGKVSSTPNRTVESVEKQRHGAIYNMMRAAESVGINTTNFWTNINSLCTKDPVVCSYVDEGTGSTPLHLACSLIDYDDGATDETSSRSVVAVIKALMKQSPDAVTQKDVQGRIPLHFVLSGPKILSTGQMPQPRWITRSHVLNILIAADYEGSSEYFSRSDIEFDKTTGRCTPLYHALESLPDDFDSPSRTAEYISVILECNSSVACQGNSSDADKPLSLLYRRFTRQFDLSEKFFPGDNSRPEVVEHRRKYKMAAGNTWKIVEQMLQPHDGDTQWRIVHRGIQVETPPDLLRYIVETNSEELTQVDEEGNLPLHYAAKSKPPDSAFPSFYTKYVIDELLYKFPEGAGIPDGEGKFPLTLAVNSGKHWIGGGVKSLYDAYPEALQQIDLSENESLKKALGMDQTTNDGDQQELKEETNGIIADEHHDAIMMVQRHDVDISEVVFAMWAHEEDAGVQMLGCVAIAKKADGASEVEVLRIALSSVAAVVNAMKAHPNEAVVQDKACSALKMLSSADNKREVSFVASGAIAAVVGAMQAHVGDPAVQVEACAAVAEIVTRGGSDRATIVASVSGLTALVNALAAHQDVESVQIEGLRALAAITDHSEANLPELPRSQTEPLLIAAKSSFPESCGKSVDMLLSRLS